MTMMMKMKMVVTMMMDVDDDDDADDDALVMLYALCFMFHILGAMFYVSCLYIDRRRAHLGIRNSCPYQNHT